ncbi:MAG TPA: hypothetical protein VK211_29120 [Kamptonema sp.]|nr:hypothetical protein [Kamptonema sp.]
MLLKLYALSGTALILWIAPLYALDKKVSWHRAIQGTSLIAAFGCALSASYTAKKLAENEAYENAKKAVLIGDLQDELAQGAYLSEQERKLQNQKYLESIGYGSASSNGSASSSDVERLERSLALSSKDSVPERSGKNAPVPNAERLERVQELKALGWGKSKIIEHIWGVTKGGSPKYKSAESEYEEILKHFEDEVE